MDLALNNLQICHKTQPTSQPTKKLHVSWCKFMFDPHSVWVQLKILKILCNDGKVFGLFLTESPSASTLLEHLAVNLLPHLGFFAF